MSRPTADESARRAIEFIGRTGRWTAGRIARECGWETRSEMAIFRVTILAQLMKDGCVEFMDDEKPAIYQLTDLGRSLLDQRPPPSSNASPPTDRTEDADVPSVVETVS